MIIKSSSPVFCGDKHLITLMNTVHADLDVVTVLSPLSLLYKSEVFLSLHMFNKHTHRLSHCWFPETADTDMLWFNKQISTIINVLPSNLLVSCNDTALFVVHFFSLVFCIFSYTTQQPLLFCQHCEKYIPYHLWPPGQIYPTKS